ncbi:hypothetical protein PENTCL1PPCAC_4275 [Pristionchus entomophagus]|uniref:Uncharacterized protein n=1 Tax=Pristionchus entomophagus TaxID=358040 RepID=A0AAV5SGX9_9BILA|nr:hypothetical protein PENTCL1PPCAC_4275 [Pristionchus entomophagus]
MQSSLVILVSILAIGAAQMTFSDGWEKRQPSRPYAHHYAHQKVARSGGHSFHEADAAAATEAEHAENVREEAAKASPMTPITNCMEEYMAGVREMHAAMMELYSRFQTCENAMANPLLPKTHEKTSSALF